MPRRKIRSSRRTSTRRRSRRDHGESNFRSYLAIAACFVIVGVLGYAVSTLWEKGRINEITLCHLGGARNITMILLDLTDPLTGTQSARLDTIIQDEVHRSSTDTMISFGVVSEDPDNWGARFAKCKPATGEDANSLYENPRLIQERYDREFMKPMLGELANAVSGEAENRSPIMEGLQSLISETPDFTRAKGERKILIVSDMLQHSDILSFYRGQGWDYFSESGGAQRLAGNLNAVSVEILLIPRSGSNLPNRTEVDDFWSRYFDRQGSRVPIVRSLGDI